MKVIENETWESGTTGFLSNDVCWKDVNIVWELKIRIDQNETYPSLLPVKVGGMLGIGGIVSEERVTL